MCSCDNDPRVRMNHQQWPENCEHSAGYEAGEYVGDDIVPVLPCPPDQFWSVKDNHCMPNIPAPPPPASLPATLEEWHRTHTSGSYVGDDIVPVLPCPPDQFWSVKDSHCMPNIPFPPPATRGGEVVGWNLFEDVFNSADPFKMIDRGSRAAQHDLHREQDSGHGGRGYGGQAYGYGGQRPGYGGRPVYGAQQAYGGRINQGFEGQGEEHRHHHHPHHEHEHREEVSGFFPDFGYAGELYEWEWMHPWDHVFWVGAAVDQVVGAEAAHAVAAATADVSAQNATQQAQAAHTAASSPQAQGTTAQMSAKAATSHAKQAQGHAQAAKLHPSPHGATNHARLAEGHMRKAGIHARNAHREMRGEGRGIGGFARRLFGGRGRFGHLEWRGVGHPGWRHGVAARWRGHRAECFRRRPWACVVEQIWDPYGNVCYRVTPAGAQEGIELEPEMVAANQQYRAATGQEVIVLEDGPLPGSEQTADGSATPPDDAGDDDQTNGQAAADPAVPDENGDGGDAAATADAGDAAAAVTGEYAGWQMPFTDPYGGFNPFAPSAWDSHFAYPGFGWGHGY